MSFEQIAFPRSVSVSLKDYSDPVKICKKGTPIHIRGSLIYNAMLEEYDLKKKYQSIKDKDKIRFSYLREPNPAMSHVIAAPDELPEELGLREYLDIEMQWDRAFKNPIKSITDVIGWEIEKTPKLIFK
jgi:hypothetical protein